MAQYTASPPRNAELSQLDLVWVKLQLQLQIQYWKKSISGQVSDNLWTLVRKVSGLHSFAHNLPECESCKNDDAGDVRSPGLLSSPNNQVAGPNWYCYVLDDD